LLWGGQSCSGEKKKIGKKGDNLANFRKNGRYFAKNRGNFRRFYSEKKTILKAIGRIFKNFLVKEKNDDFLKKF